MERHNTHILSESQDDEEKDENNHFYEFNDTDNSESNSLKNTIHSNSKKESKFSLNELIQSNNNEEKEIINDSLISSRDLEDVFYNEQRFIKKPDKKKGNNKDEKNKEPDNVKIKMIKLNYEDNLSILNEYLSSTPYIINRLKLRKVKKKRRCVSFENIRQKPKPKPKLKLSKNEDNSKKNKKASKKKKINKPLKSESESNSDFTKSSKEDEKNGKKVKSLYDILKSKNLKLLKISQNSFMINQEKNNYNFYEEKMNNFKRKVKSMNSFGDPLYNKIQKQNEIYYKHDYNNNNSLKRNYFSPAKIKINGHKRFEILQIRDKDDRFKHPEINSRLIILNDNNSQYSLRYHNNSCNNQDYIRRQYNNEFRNHCFNENEKNFCYNNFINKEQDRNYIHNYEGNNYNENYIACLNRMKKMNLINQNINTRPNYGLKLKSDKKIKILYDLYCKQPCKEKKLISRINSAYSIKNRNIFRNGYNLLDLNENSENNDNMLKRRLYKESNNNNWLLKLLRIQKEKNTRHYEKHFGNNQSCPLCQQMDKKNEEQIKKIGVFHLPPSDYKKTEERSTSKKRRINSAFPIFNVENNVVKENELVNSKSTLHFNKSSALFNDSGLKKKLFNINNLNRKIQINKQKCLNNNFS